MTMNGYQFAAWLRNIALDLRYREEDCFANIAEHVMTSVLVGSPVTGAPGQPIDTGELIGSWTMTMSVPSRYAKYESSAAHAEIIETNARGAKLRSKVGGFHSVAITMANLNKIIAHEAGKIGAQPALVEAGGKRYRDPATGRFAKAP